MDTNTIKGPGEFRYEEAVGNGTITPGMLVELEAAGTVKPHATEGGFAERLFAAEDALQGKAVGDNYASGARVSMLVALPGSEVFALVATQHDVEQGEQLVSNGAGMLMPVGDIDSSTTLRQVVAVALEDADLDDSSGVANRLVRVRVL